MFCALALNPARFARPFHTFMPRSHGAVVEFDASLEGAGVKLLLVDRAQGTEAPLGAGRISLGEFVFVAVLAGLVALAKALALARALGERRGEVRVVLLRGDSVAALTWGGKQRYRGDAVSGAAAVLAILLISLDVHVSVEHVPGEDNGECDKLSRKDKGQWRDVSALVPGVRDLELHNDRDLRELIDLCNPAHLEIQDEDYLGFWRRARALVDRVSVNWSRRRQSNRSTIKPYLCS